MKSKQNVFRLFAMIMVIAMLFSNIAPGVQAVQAQEDGPTPDASASFAITGRIVDAQGAGLLGVVVTDNQGHSAQTDADGNYALTGVSSGEVLVRPQPPQDVPLLPYYRVVQVDGADVSGVDFYVPAQAADAVQPVVPSFDQSGPVQTPRVSDSWGLPDRMRPAPSAAQSQGADLDAQTVPTMGEPGLVYRFDRTFGTPYAPYPVDPRYLFEPHGLFIGGGKLYITETGGNRVQRFTTWDAGHIFDNLKLGYEGGKNHDPLHFPEPSDVTADEDGNIWVVDPNRLESYSATGAFGFITPASSSQNSGSGNDRFNNPRGVAAYTTAGTTYLYVADEGNDRVQIFSRQGSDPSTGVQYLATLDQSINVWDGSDNLACPSKVVVDGSNLYVVSSCSHLVYRCTIPMDPTSTGDYQCRAYVGEKWTAGNSLDRLKSPEGVAFAGGYVFVADSGNQRILRCDKAAGSACTHFAGVAGEYGSDTQHFSWVGDIASDGTYLYVSDQYNHRVQVFDVNSKAYVGSYGNPDDPNIPVPYPTADGYLNTPIGVAVDGTDGSLYVLEEFGSRLVKMDADGNPLWDVAIPGRVAGSRAYPSRPQGDIALDAVGRIFVPDTSSQRVLIFSKEGLLITQIGETDVAGSDNAHFSAPFSVAISPTTGDIYVADSENQRVQVFDANLQYKATLGVTGAAGSDALHFSNPTSVAVAPDGSIYVSDSGNYVVKKCVLQGQSGSCVPFVGTSGVQGWDVTHFNYQTQVAVGLDGKVFISDRWNSNIKVYESSGAFRAFVGFSGNVSKNPDAKKARAAYGGVYDTRGMAVDAQGNVYVASRMGQVVQKYAPGLPGWQAFSLPGFGESNEIGALLKVRGQIFAGTEDWNGRGAQLWSWDPYTQWRKVFDGGLGDVTTQAIYSLTVYKDYLYAGGYSWKNSSNSPAAARLLRCPLAANPDQLSCLSASDWSPVTAPWDAWNFFSQRMTVADGNLYVGGSLAFGSGVGQTPPHGAQLWKWNGSAWTKSFETPNIATDYERDIFPVTEHNGALYLGTRRLSAAGVPYGARIYRCVLTNGCDEQTDWVQVNTDGFGDGNAYSVAGLASFNGSLYASVSMYANAGARVLRLTGPDGCSGAGCSWAQVNSDGFGDISTYRINDLKVIQGKLFALASNPNYGGALWQYDGANWSLLENSDGFGTWSWLEVNGLIEDDGRLLVAVVGQEPGVVWMRERTDGHTISGYVEDTAAAPLQGVQVALAPGGQVAATDAAGYYHFDNLANGEYYLEPTHGAYSFNAASVTLADADAVQNFTAQNQYALALLSPADGTLLTGNTVTLDWENAAAPGVRYLLQVTNYDDTLYKTISGLTTSQYTLSGLLTNRAYLWRAAAYTGSKPPVAPQWSQEWKLLVPALPAAPTLLAPANNAILPNAQPVLDWDDVVVAAGGGMAGALTHYEVQIATDSAFTKIELHEATLNAASSYAVDGELSPDRSFYWRVRGVADNGALGNWSKSSIFKTLPRAVWARWPDDYLTLTPLFQWEDPYKIGSYQLELRDVAANKTVLTTVTGATTYRSKPLPMDTHYIYRVRVKGKIGWSNWSNEVDFWSAWTPQPPAAVAPAANASVNGGAAVDFSWTHDPDVLDGGGYYQIQWASQPDFRTASVLQDAQTAETHYAYDVNYNQTLYWRLRVCDRRVQCSVWTVARKLMTYPSAPVLDAPADDDTNQEALVSFSWHDVSSWVPKHQLVICGDDQCTRIVRTISAGYSYAQVPGLAPLQHFWWRVRGQGTAGFGPWSAIQSFHTPVVVPVPQPISPAVNAVISTSSGQLFQWNPVNLPGYTLEYEWKAQQQPYGRYHAQTTPSTSYTEVISTAGVYLWQVRACAQQGGGPRQCSLWSKPVNLFTQGQLVGHVVNAENGDWLNNLTVSLSAALKSGPVARTIATNGGDFQFDDLADGVYTLSFEKFKDNGFIPVASQIVKISKGLRVDVGEIQTLPTPPAGQVRMVISWPQSDQRMLASHLWLPSGKPAHLSAANPGRLGGLPNAALTAFSSLSVVTLDALQDGDYQLAALYASAKKLPLPGSGARVEVYDENGPIAGSSFAVPAKGSGNWWNILRLHVVGGVPTVVPVNTLAASMVPPYPDVLLQGQTLWCNPDCVRPIGEAVITAVHPGSGVQYTAIAGWDGKFSLPVPQPGDYTLSAALPGYQFTPASQTVTVADLTHLTVALPAPFAAQPDGNNYQGRLGSVKGMGSLAYLAAGNRLDILNLQQPAAPVALSRLKTGSSPILNLALTGNYVYLAQGNEGLNVVDIRNPAAPQLVGWLNSFTVGSGAKAAVYPFPVYDVEIIGRYAYLTTGSILRVADITDPTRPVLVGALALPRGAELLTAFKNTLYVSGGAGLINRYGRSYLQVVDVSTPSKPKSLGVADETFGIFSLEVVGNHLYLGDDTEWGVNVYELSVPAHPVLVGGCNTNDQGIYSIAVNGSMLAWSGGWGDNQLAKASSPNSYEYDFAADLGSGSAGGLTWLGDYLLQSVNTWSEQHLVIWYAKDASSPLKVTTYTP